MLARLAVTPPARSMSSGISGGGRQSPGILLYPLVKGAQLRAPHQDDIWRDKYQRVVQNVVVPMATRMVHPGIPSYLDRFTQLLSDNSLLFPNWSFAIEHTYRALVGEENLTEDKLTNIWILRACQDLLFSGAIVLDDLAEGSDTRLHRAAWHTTCQGGTTAAMYDAILMFHVSYYVARNCFRPHTQCVNILESLMEGTCQMLIGVTYELLTSGTSEKTMENYLKIHNIKTGIALKNMPTLGLLLAEVTDRKLISSMEGIFTELGAMEQCWDDFSEAVSNAEELGKPVDDIARGINTWTSALAMTTLDQPTRDVFKECYGSRDPKKVSKIQEIYSSMNIPKLYLEHMKQKDRELDRAIANVPDERLRRVCHSYKDWFIGGIYSEEVQRICNS